MQDGSQDSLDTQHSGLASTIRLAKGVVHKSSSIACQPPGFVSLHAGSGSHAPGQISTGGSSAQEGTALHKLPPSSQTFCEVPLPAHDTAQPGLLPALGAWQSSDSQRLYTLFRKPPASLADLLRFDPDALASDGAVDLILYQASFMHSISVELGAEKSCALCAKCSLAGTLARLNE